MQLIATIANANAATATVAIGASSLIDALAVVLIATSIAMVGARRLRELILLLALQSLLLGVVALTVAYTTGSLHIYLAAFLTFTVKVVAIPAYLFWVLRRIRIAGNVAEFLPRKGTLIIALALVLLVYWQVSYVHVPTAIPSTHALPAAVSMVLLGMLLMLVRSKALTQIVGLMCMENGLYLFAMSTTYGMPIVVELGILFDILVAVLLMGVFAFRINNTFDTINVANMRDLKG
jgi:hydrogenase-4 component E